MYLDVNTTHQNVVSKNQFNSRTFTINSNILDTSGYPDLRTGYNYSGDHSNEFSFLLNRVEITGMFTYDKQGGIFVVFRNDSPVINRKLLIPRVKENGKYNIIGKFRGNTLLENGTKISLENRNPDKVFEIRLINNQL